MRCADRTKWASWRHERARLYEHLYNPSVWEYRNSQMALNCVGRLVLQLEMMRRSVESYWKTALYLSLNYVLPLSVAQTVVFSAVCCSFRRSSANQWTSCTTIKGYASLLTSQVVCAVTSVSGIIAASFAVLSLSPSSISLPSFVSIMGHPLCVLCCSSSSLPTPQLWEC